MSLCISIMAVGDQMALSAMSSGGSQAMFFKLNTFGEESVLRLAVAAIKGYGT